MNHSAIVVENHDNVATALRNLSYGESIRIDLGHTESEIRLTESIAQGFKIALQNINKGQSVIKYGEVIGLATRSIVRGECVHVHNIEGIKGRGDKS
ncbi:UxaA family hydrolase [Chloroflexota bacterium]